MNCSTFLAIKFVQTITCFVQFGLLSLKNNILDAPAIEKLLQMVESNTILRLLVFVSHVLTLPLARVPPATTSEIWKEEETDRERWSEKKIHWGKRDVFVLIVDDLQTEKAFLKQPKIFHC